MKVGLITFHASHNYGSMLQAYALQQTVLKLGHQCEIINLRTKVQRSFYRPFFAHKDRYRILKALRYPRLAFDDVRKYQKFEKFLKENYILSPQTYATAKELKEANLDYDCYISGSDQIWNTKCLDFQTSYFLDFVKQGKRIAYAPSMGPNPFKQIDKRAYVSIKDYVFCYDAVSVREQDAATLLKQVSGVTAQVVLDPTLLVCPQEWSALAGEKPLIKEDYIFVYTPWYDDYKQLFTVAAELAEKYDLKIISSMPDNVSRWRNNVRFQYYTAVGPIEFLNLVKYSKYMFCGSFHAVVFSILFNKPFYAYEGMNDSRIAPLLKMAVLERCATLRDGELPMPFNAEEAKKNLKLNIMQSIQFLNDAIGNRQVASTRSCETA